MLCVMILAVGLLAAVGLAVSVGCCSTNSLCWVAAGGLHASIFDLGRSLVQSL